MSPIPDATRGSSPSSALERFDREMREAPPDWQGWYWESG